MRMLRQPKKEYQLDFVEQQEQHIQQLQARQSWK